jgi:hypothetical protein
VDVNVDVEMDSRRDRAILVRLLGMLEDGAAGAGETSDERGLLEVARHHRLSPLLSASTARLSPGIREACKRDKLITTARNLVLSQVAQECISALEAAGIPTVVLKGLAYEDLLYAREGPGARPTGDVDLLVPGPSRRAAFAVLDRLRFEPRAAAPGFDDPDYHEVAWERNGVEVDLHLALAPLARCNVNYADVWSSLQAIRLGDVAARTLASHHAAVFHALHMAIDHFAIPAIYLIDFARLLDSEAALSMAQAAASAWRCERPLQTALALTAEFVPGWSGTRRLPAGPRRAVTIVRGYGSTGRLPRADQLRRKLSHFDTPRDAVAYIAVQARRNAREFVERRWRKRTARERLQDNGLL